jgi:hypothetical protein
MRLLLLHSPFLGPSVWSALSSVLRGHGCDTLAPDLRSALSAGAGTYQRVAEQISGLVSDGTVLVVHSGAGALVPSIQDAAGPGLKSVVFMDALLPHPASSWFDTLPPGTANKLRALVVDGFAPPWPSWLPSGMLDQLLPNANMRQDLAAEAPNVPLAYLSAPAPNLARWSQALGLAYLQLSGAYADEAKAAEKLGWPIERLAGHHLSMMTQPEQVGASLLRLAAQLAG